MGRSDQPNTELTSRDKDALEFIVGFRAAHGKMPTMRQIAEHMGARSPNAGQRYVDQLRKKGYLEDRPTVVTTLTSKGKWAGRAALDKLPPPDKS
jgi:Mn-dependent DtxR family transcriptional regulator